jgi:hypothetical protein
MVQGIIFKSLPEELNSAKITLTQAQDEWKISFFSFCDNIYVAGSPL